MIDFSSWKLNDSKTEKTRGNVVISDCWYLVHMLNCWTSPGHLPHSTAAESVPTGSLDSPVIYSHLDTSKIYCMYDTIGIGQSTLWWFLTKRPKPDFWHSGSKNEMKWITTLQLVLCSLVISLFILSNLFSCPLVFCTFHICITRILWFTAAELETSPNLLFVLMSDFYVKAGNTWMWVVKWHICLKAMCRCPSH